MKVNKIWVLLFLITGGVFIYQIFSDQAANNKHTRGNDVAPNSKVGAAKSEEMTHSGPTKSSQMVLPMPKEVQNEEAWQSWLNNDAKKIAQLAETPDKVQDPLQQSAESLPKE